MDSWINANAEIIIDPPDRGFNPCFNGFMDKCTRSEPPAPAPARVSTLVLMDSWINASSTYRKATIRYGFNPCFNGFMDKCNYRPIHYLANNGVSTLVLMDSWINAIESEPIEFDATTFQPLF